MLVERRDRAAPRKWWTLPVAWEGLMVAGIAAALAVLWILKLGPDINADFLSYHLYIGLHAGGDTLSTDYFPAGASSYLLPYAQWPLSAMIAADWPPRVIGAMLSILHSTAAIATWLVALQLFPGRSRVDTASRIVATVLGAMSPLVLTGVGSSHVDLLTAIPVVVGLALVLKSMASERHRSGWMLAGGLFFGAATALKLTNATMAIAVGMTVAAAMFYRRDVSFGQVVAMGCGVVLGFVLTYGYWGLLLYREFGNPMFPFFDPAFKVKGSPQAAPAVDVFSPFLNRLWTFRDGLHQRFLPHGWNEWLLRPLYMSDPSPDVYAEVRAPDARFLVLVLIAPFAVWKLRKRDDHGLLPPLLLFIVFGWILWMTLFGNGRYMLPIALAAGPALVACFRLCSERSPQWGWLAAGVLILVQSTLMYEGARFRWGQSAWQDRWIDARLPANITSKAVTFVVLNNVAPSWLTLFVHPRSRFVYPDAISVKASTSELAARLPKILAESPRLVAVFVYNRIDPVTKKPIPELPVDMRPLAENHKLIIDFPACQSGELLDGLHSPETSSSLGGMQSARTSAAGYFFCPARYDPAFVPTPVDPVFEAAFDNLEQACRVELPPGTTYTGCSTNICWRRYPTTDAIVTINDAGETNVRRYGGYDNPYLGQAIDLAKSAKDVNCYPELGRYVPWHPGANMLSRPRTP